MTAQILAAELGNLVQDSKRKNTELRNAAEKSLQDLKGLPNTSEIQLSADLARRPHFISPFLIACSTHNAKFGSYGVSGISRLSVARALPRERLNEVLDALKDCVSLSHDVQLKILQALPSLLQNYQQELRGELLSTALSICSALQNVKNFAVSNTAAATLQQLVISVYDRVATEDERALEIPTSAEVKTDADPVPVRPAAHDAYKVFKDLNMIVNGEKPTFLRFSSMPLTLGLELVEAVLSNHSQIISKHTEQAQVLRTLLMPMIIRSLSDRSTFPVTLRVVRVLNLLIRNHLALIPSECEIALGLLNHMLDPEASALWKRALCLEVFRGLYSDPRLVLQIYGEFDEQEGKRCIFGDNLAAFVRLATEKPAVIGLGQQSTVPSDGWDTASDQAVAEAGAIAGVIGGPASDSHPGGNPAGISTQWSTIKTPCMEHLDKVDPPALPETYVYSLVLTCITNLSESLAKFILPLTVHYEGKKKKGKNDDLANDDEETASPSSKPRRLSRTQSYRKKSVPINPLSLTDHSASSSVSTTAGLVGECWPAVLATCSTFLNAALDSDYYRSLVRAIQKFTQVAGLLRLSTPRDAFLTTLGKAAVPANIVLGGIASPRTTAPETPSMFTNPKGLLSVDSLVSQASSLSFDKNRRQSHDFSLPSLGPRNLLCLRALLNLAIALGPTLQSAWSIVFETLQTADFVMAASNQIGGRIGGIPSRPDTDSSSEKVETETSAVQAAARRLFESTVDYPNDAFVELLEAICLLLHGASPPDSTPQTPTGTTATRPQALQQRRLGSTVGLSLNTESNARDSAFSLNKIGELASLNESRLSHYSPRESGWDVLVTELVRFSADNSKATSARLLSADILSRTMKEIAEISMADEQREEIQSRVLSALQSQIKALHQHAGRSEFYDEADIKVHQIALEALKNVIEQCGESLTAGWDSVFAGLLSAFSTPTTDANAEDDGSKSQQHEASWRLTPVHVISRQLARSAFGSVQLICSDFLASVPDKSTSTLLELLLKFASQQEDLNMSLTTITFFWNVSDFLHSRGDLSSLPQTLGSSLRQTQMHDKIDSLAQDGNIPTLWLKVLLHLSAITTDNRAELRNSAVQTVQRIFENYVDQLSSDSWFLCLRTVLFRMVESNLAAQTTIRAGSQPPAEIAAWNETTKVILGSVSLLMSTYVDKVQDPDKLGRAWSTLLDFPKLYFACGSHALGASVFMTISGVLSRIDEPKMIGKPALLKTADVWKTYLDYRSKWDETPEPNQEAFVAYAEAFKALYRLTQNYSELDVASMLTNLEQCIIDSDDVAYSSDIDHMTSFQTQFVACLSIVRTERDGLPPFLVKLLSRMSVLPYTSAEAKPEKRGPTFVALAKASMSSLESIAVKHINDESIYSSGAFQLALASLAKPIQQKYIWQKEGKAPSVWQKATTVAITILEAGLPHIKSHTVKGVWSEVVKLASAIIGAQISTTAPPSNLEEDEAFDIDAFEKLRDLTTFSLGSPTVPDSLRRTYTRTLFETSIIHAPELGEIPHLVEAPLEDLYKIRFGHTLDPEPALRTAMAYLCFSELRSLVSVHEGSTERIKLAQAAAPYLILRVALPLRAYIADQPLRGRMPAPELQRRELLFVLKEMRTLESEPQAIPDVPNVKSKYKKHLHRLYPLLAQAMRVAKGDRDVFGELVGLVDIVGAEFGLDE